ncbi:hypothetical protein CYMTET_23136 [Cymbomonas tetramitiformis]|uniref:Uncharacterized protein n=1 Tax=Cymbomonas tetramitiformis TaxID=36881 RepID=A0AAE0L1I1_9CHLO|nr:hypothetical protein CYMTET_23136 [Cymbomonas tetramitiformis]
MEARLGWPGMTPLLLARGGAMEARLGWPGMTPLLLAREGAMEALGGPGMTPLLLAREVPWKRGSVAWYDTAAVGKEGAMEARLGGLGGCHGSAAWVAWYDTAAVGKGGRHGSAARVAWYDTAAVGKEGARKRLGWPGMTPLLLAREGAMEARLRLEKAGSRAEKQSQAVQAMIQELDLEETRIGAAPPEESSGAEFQLRLQQQQSDVEVQLAALSKESSRLGKQQRKQFQQLASQDVSQWLFGEGDKLGDLSTEEKLTQMEARAADLYSCVPFLFPQIACRAGGELGQQQLLASQTTEILNCKADELRLMRDEKELNQQVAAQLKHELSQLQTDHHHLSSQKSMELSEIEEEKEEMAAQADELKSELQSVIQQGEAMLSERDQMLVAAENEKAALGYRAAGYCEQLQAQVEHHESACKEKDALVEKLKQKGKARGSGDSKELQRMLDENICKSAKLMGDLELARSLKNDMEQTLELRSRELEDLKAEMQSSEEVEVLRAEMRAVVKAREELQHVVETQRKDLLESEQAALQLQACPHYLAREDYT